MSEEWMLDSGTILDLAEARAIRIMKKFILEGFPATPEIILKVVESAYAQGFADASGVRDLQELEEKVQAYLKTCDDWHPSAGKDGEDDGNTQ